ncbi:SH3 domain-containing protein [Mediannikoviicoccus vaginalis]|uniref:SH3 domain-containing protein n=1 Tax=Mediannikoviicoccus vaginalis TaxID=2899727 RepID=UPI001F30A620|nr:SH3 domain-containing protein [Mediannikoviicoccus vaginalis]
MNLKKSSKFAIGIAAIIFIIIIAIISSYAVNKSGIKKLEEEAMSYVNDEDFGPASTIYSRLYTKTGDKKYQKEREETTKLKSESKIYHQGETKLEEGDYLSAIKILVRIDRQDSRYYEKANGKLKEAEDNIISEVNKAIEDDNVYFASSILKDYVKVVGDSEKANELLSKVNLQAPDEDTDEENGNTNINSSNVETEELPESPKNWVGKTVEIKAQRSNLRAEPDLNGRVVGLAIKGDVIKIKKIKNDGNRIWCYGTITKSKDGKQVEAWISGKLLQ